MEVLLKNNNSDLLREVEVLKGVILTSNTSEILNPLKNWLQNSLQLVEQGINDNFYYLSLNKTSLHEDVLKRTQSLTRFIRLISSKFISSIYRFRNNDVLSLKLLDWLHNEHSQTVQIPFGISDGGFSVYPDKSLPILYFLPNSSQFSLLHLPLLFHEFGHYLYAFHEKEMHDISKAMQNELDEWLTGSFQQNDSKYEKEKKDAALIVDTWYVWIQEIFCDAVGLSIGGASYLHAFSHYLRMSGKMAFYRLVKDLSNSTHPVSWARVKLLKGRAINLGLTSEAKVFEEEWNKLAAIMGEKGNFHAYYLDAYKDIINRAIDDMLIETNPIKFSDYLKEKSVFDISKNNFIELLNFAWCKFHADADKYY